MLLPFGQLANRLYTPKKKKDSKKSLITGFHRTDVLECRQNSLTTVRSPTLYSDKRYMILHVSRTIYSAKSVINVNEKT